MKKFLSVLPLSLMLAACATGPVETVQNTTNKAYDRMMPEQFVCQDNATLQVKYSIDGSQSTINANVPKAKWNNQTIILDEAVAASGSRYVNSDSDNVEYEWHSKGNMGIFSMMWKDGKTSYSVNCERAS